MLARGYAHKERNSYNNHDDVHGEYVCILMKKCRTVDLYMSMDGVKTAQRGVMRGHFISERSYIRGRFNIKHARNDV